MNPQHQRKTRSSRSHGRLHLFPIHSDCNHIIGHSCNLVQSRAPSAQPSAPLQDRRLVPGCRGVAGSRRTTSPDTLRLRLLRWALHLGSSRSAEPESLAMSSEREFGAISLYHLLSSLLSFWRPGQFQWVRSDEATDQLRWKNVTIRNS